MKEFFRKLMVSLKRRPHNIPLVGLLLAFLYFALNLTKISDTTAKIQGANMGLSAFVIMLFSILVFVCFMNSFPRRQKPNIIMLCVTYLMLGCIVLADFNYRRCILNAYATEGFADVVAKNPYISQAQSVISVHMILILCVAVLIALIPVYSKLLKKINTNIDLEYSGKMADIEIEE